MASPSATATTSRVLLAVVLVALTTAGGAGAANILIVNKCPYAVWPAAFPKGGGTQLNPGESVGLLVPAGTGGMRIWGRTGCIFAAGDGDHGDGCKTGDCAGALHCRVPGNPATLAEFTIGKDAGDSDFYDVSVVDGFNVPMDFSSSTAGGDGPIKCRDPACPDGSHPGAPKVRRCRGNSDYIVTFCP